MGILLSSSTGIAILAALSLVGSGVKQDRKTPARTPLSHKCDRVLSRAVRREIKERILSIAVTENHRIPKTCLLHPDNDLFTKQEEAKARTSGPGKAPFANWECKICKKRFRSEHYIDLHMERKHPELHLTAKARVCAAEYCSLFDLCGTRGVGTLRRGSFKSSMLDHANCEPAKLEKMRQTCEIAIASCFPLKINPKAATMLWPESSTSKTADSTTESSTLSTDSSDSILRDREAISRRLNVRFRRELCTPLDCRYVKYHDDGTYYFHKENEFQTSFNISENEEDTAEIAEEITGIHPELAKNLFTKNERDRQPASDISKWSTVSIVTLFLFIVISFCCGVFLLVDNSECVAAFMMRFFSRETTHQVVKKMQRKMKV